MEENPLSWLCAVGESFILIRLNAVSLQRVYHIFNSIWCSLGILLNRYVWSFHGGRLGLARIAGEGCAS